jgi:hypothetical protein
MKIINIELKNGIYYVTKNPNFIQKIFGVKTKNERYKTKGEVFHYFPQLKVFYSSNGKMVSPIDEMCDILNNFERRF